MSTRLRLVGNSILQKKRLQKYYLRTLKELLRPRQILRFAPVLIPAAYMRPVPAAFSIRGGQPENRRANQRRLRRLHFDQSYDIAAGAGKLSQRHHTGDFHGWRHDLAL